MRIVVGFFLLLLHSLAVAQTPVDVHVASDPNPNDTVGQQLVYVIREKLRASNGLRLIDNRDNAPVRLSITTLDPDTGRNIVGLNTVFSVVYTYRTPYQDTNTFLGHAVGLCPHNAIETCAQNIVAQMDSYAVEYRRTFN